MAGLSLTCALGTAWRGLEVGTHQVDEESPDRVREGGHVVEGMAQVGGNSDIDLCHVARVGLEPRALLALPGGVSLFLP